MEFDAAAVAVTGFAVTAFFTWRTQRLTARSEAWTRFNRGVDLVLADGDGRATDTGWVILSAVVGSDLAFGADVEMIVAVMDELARQRARQRRGR